MLMWQVLIDCIFFFWFFELKSLVWEHEAFWITHQNPMSFTRNVIVMTNNILEMTNNGKIHLIMY